jgi:sulfur carrier protein ThiS
MKIKVRFLPRNTVEEVDVPKGMTISALIQQMHIGPGPFVVLKNNVPVSVDTVISDEGEFSILQVIPGG